jgi:peroxiredoxin
MMSRRFVAVFIYAVFLVMCFIALAAFAQDKPAPEVPEQFLGKESATVTVDSKAPDFELPNAQGEVRKLSELLELGPVILTFYRGGWCPYCNDQLYALQQLLPEFEELGAQLVAVSPEKPESAADTVLKDGLTFEVLSDVGNVISRRYDLLWTVPEEKRAEFSEWLKQETGKTLVEFNGVDNYELPIPATFVIAQDGTVVYVFKDKDYTKRANPDDIMTALEHLAEHEPEVKE